MSLIFSLSSASGTSAVAIDNKIEQAMVSVINISSFTYDSISQLAFYVVGYGTLLNRLIFRFLSNQDFHVKRKYANINLSFKILLVPTQPHSLLPHR